MVRVLIASDHRIFRQGLARLLADHAELGFITEAGTVQEAIESQRSFRTDLAILDLAMPGTEGLELIGQLQGAAHAVKVLATTTMQNGDATALRALRAGADGFMTRDSSPEDVVTAIHQVMNGMRYVCPALAERLALGVIGGGERGPAHEALSAREYRVFEMLVAGKRGSEIAGELSLSEKTVSTHKSHVLRKLDLHTSADLVRYAIHHRLITG